MTVRILCSIALGLSVALSPLTPANADQTQTTTPPQHTKAKRTARSGTPPHANSAAGEVGWASWYGKAHQGKRTAGGKAFDKEAMVAAHRTLPMGSKARITNLSNGKTVDVEVVDRGPVRHDRVIDLSEGAARIIDMKNAGVAKVLVEPLPGDPTQVQTAKGE